MPTNAASYYPPAAGLPSGATIGGLSQFVAPSYPMAAQTPTSSTVATPAKAGIHGIATIAWALAFLVGGLVLLHLGEGE